MIADDRLEAHLQALPTQKAREKWRVSILDASGRLAFDSNWVSIRCSNRNSARVLAVMVSTTIAAGLYAPPPGNLRAWMKVADLSSEWQAWDADDWAGTLRANDREISLRAEHLEGPLRGGVWWWAADGVGLRISQTETQIDGKKLESAQWLAEVAGRAIAASGIVDFRHLSLKFREE